MLLESSEQPQTFSRETPDGVEKDPRELTVEVLDLNGVEIRLVGCDHDPRYMPEKDPWGKIEEQIKTSSLVFVEYFPYELENALYTNPIWGPVAKAMSEAKGNEDFFGRVTQQCITHSKQIAVADIANGPIYSIHHGVWRTIPTAVGLSTLGSGDLALSVTLTGAGTFYNILTNTLEVTQQGPFSKERNDLERYFVDMEDARRLYTARALLQEANRRTKGSALTYISPPAHTNRVKWYIENQNDLVTRVKSKLYTLAVGLPRSTRIYKYSRDYNSWQLVSNMETRA